MVLMASASVAGLKPLAARRSDAPVAQEHQAGLVA